MRDEHTTVPIVGRHPVREALEDRDLEIEKVWLRQGMRGPVVNDIRRLAKDRGVPVQFVPEARLNSLARGANHQGVAAQAAPIVYQELHDMMASIAQTTDDVRRTKPLVLMLDGIQDPYNYGAILRSAAAVGAAGVIVPRHGAAPISAVTIKASAGTAGRVPISRVTNIADAIYQLKERGYWVVGASGGADTSMWEMDWDRPLVLVIGAEGRGLGKRVASECDYLVRIPMSGEAESLNASVAAGILMFVAAGSGHRPGLS